MNLLVLGPQGAGKGTQAKRIAADYGIPHVSTGDMFRAAIATGSPLGQKVEPILAAGELVPDELTVALIRERLDEDDARDGFVLDGFPRNLAQAEALDAMLAGIGRGLDAILFFDLPDDVATERMLKRAADEARPDDTPEVIARRLEIYHAETEPIVEHYRATGKLVVVDAAGSVDEVYAEVQEALEQLGGARVIIRKSSQEIELMARAGEVVAGVLALAEERLEPGISMSELDRIAEEYIRAHGGVPTSMGYKGFPAATCISPNAMIVHGIPDGYEAREGDIVSVDVGVTKDGLIADSAATFGVGEIDPEAQRLLDVCKAALEAGIEAAQLGASVGDISAAVQTVTEDAGFSVVRSLVGHGVGRSYHEDPQVPNFATSYRGPELREGMTLAIEPMITAGGPEVFVHDDQWSISTVDGSLAAHFEHTVAITKDGPRVLTKTASVLVP